MSGSSALSQSEQSPWIPDFNGYMKVMDIYTYSPDLNQNPKSTLFHNRLNFKWYFSNTLTGRVEGRSRFFIGEGIEAQQPLFGKLLEQDNGLVDLSFVPYERDFMLAHINIDRLWLEYVKGDWNIKAGRQRINWGINITWNPNDIFNTYDFLDFDYEERPGNDAVKVTKYLSDLSFIEVATSLNENLEKMVIAGKYQMNNQGYDVQFLGGKFLEDIVVGTGWAGNIKDAGFKGELSYFHPYEDIYGSSGVYNFSTSSDYSFENGWFVNATYLFNSNANEKLPFILLLELVEQSPKNLYPAKHTFAAGTGKQLSPLSTFSFSSVYSPKAKALILLPAITLSIEENFDFDFIAQSFFGEYPVKFKNITNGIYLRLKVSF
ncbi:MAG: hypothetical protein HKO56_00800 [Bacteroidia bacterium]|nr:hypothetical protein [Bacteroidia bacterium]NNC85214.1 hypothetical protein [Bacteroidia bacterium]NNM15164.1 hypothetical protein [Bacteroidia bacterium]